MNTAPFPIRQRAAMSILELLIAMGAMAVMGGLVYYVLSAGMILFAKNTAVNVAHQAARVAVLTMEHDLHSAISIPELVDANRTPLPSGSTAPAAGIAFQMFVEGPFELVGTAAAGQSVVTVNSTGYTPKVGQRFNLPLHQHEATITAITGAGSNNSRLTLDKTLPFPVETTLKPDGAAAMSVVVTGFTSERFCYVVNNGQLRYFRPGGDAAGRVLANNITSATPFSVPLSPQGALYNRFVAAINLSTADLATSNRGFNAANMFLNAMVPYRAKLCFSQ